MEKLTGQDLHSENLQRKEHRLPFQVRYDLYFGHVKCVYPKCLIYLGSRLWFCLTGGGLASESWFRFLCGIFVLVWDLFRYSGSKLPINVRVQQELFRWWHLCCQLSQLYAWAHHLVVPSFLGWEEWLGAGGGGHQNHPKSHRNFLWSKEWQWLELIY